MQNNRGGIGAPEERNRKRVILKVQAKGAPKTRAKKGERSVIINLSMEECEGKSREGTRKGRDDAGRE